MQGPRIERVLERLGDLYTPAKNVTKKDIRVWDGALAPGYGRIGQRSLEAIRLMASLEGLFLDPVYTAKSFSAIPSLVETGDIPTGARVCFVHTGGLAALYAYEDQLAHMLASKVHNSLLAKTHKICFKICLKQSKKFVLIGSREIGRRVCHCTRP